MIEDFENKIIEGDSIHILPQISDGVAKLAIIDPPYFTACQQLWPEQFKTMDDYLFWYEKWLKEVYRILTDEASLYVFVPPLEFAEVHILIKKYFVQNQIISWIKRNVMVRQPTARTYFPKTEFVGFYTKDEKKYTWNRIAKVYGLQKSCNFALDPTIHKRVGEGVNHPTQKPLKLCAKFVYASSNEGDVVLDPFCGSGTTLLAAKLLDRKFLGIELKPKYYKLSKRRIGQHSKENLSEKSKGAFF
jgi:site-specific DNA-methyltransferase (adenine-specific)